MALKKQKWNLSVVPAVRSAGMDIDIPGTNVSRRKAIRLALCGFATLAIAFSGSGLRWLVAAAGPERPQEVEGAQDFAPGSVIEPTQLAALLTQSGEKPAVICVGFKFLYDTAHVPGALYLGPAREAGGLASLEKWAEDIPRNRAVVLYCGCCPWDKCPNVRPAYAALKKKGSAHLMVLHINQDFAKDWVEKGLPTEKK